MTDTNLTSPQTTVQLLHDLGELHTRTLVSPLPKQPAALGWQSTTGAMAAGFARALHALHQADPDKAQEITDWFQGPFEDEGPDPEEHTDWLERVIAGGDLALMEKWVEDGRRLAEASRQATEERETADWEPLRLILSKALALGTGAPWDAIRDRATELAAIADSVQETSR
ncbi:hypothetical protein [Streptomyces ardesiacus]|uniref:hypothetical protein n=1 Tax=Streptomyces ardesiacus TaxID=285564 RepID=UPI0036861789